MPGPVPHAEDAEEGTTGSVGPVPLLLSGAWGRPESKCQARRSHRKACHLNLGLRWGWGMAVRERFLEEVTQNRVLKDPQALAQGDGERFSQ